MLAEFNALFAQTRNAFRQHRVWVRARNLAIAHLVCLGRRTLTGVQATQGNQFHDWTATCRLFKHKRFNADRLFDVIRQQIYPHLKPNAPLVVAMDDTILHKTGRKIHGVSYRRDPLSPPFNANLVLGQRILQLSAALPDPKQAGQARMVPIDLRHIPTSVKPKKTASEEEWEAYKDSSKLSRMSFQGVKAIQHLRERMDREQKQRALWVVVDGSYTNRTVCRDLPERTVLIGRIRKDTRLFFQPKKDRKTNGRPRKYGLKAPTPEEFLKDPSYPFQEHKVWASGKSHQCRVKVMPKVMTRWLGVEKTASVLAVAPLRYRETKNGKLKYRDPAYLICTDPNLAIPEILQAYSWRWDIEVNFRDEKQQLGLGQAQVRTVASTQAVPQFIVACYGMLLLAAHHSFRDGEGCLPPPKWRRKKPKLRYSTRDLQQALRHELWGHSLSKGTLAHFAPNPTQRRSTEKSTNSIYGAVLYAS